MPGALVSFTRLLKADGRSIPDLGVPAAVPPVDGDLRGARRLRDGCHNSPLRQIQTLLVDAIGVAPEGTGSSKLTSLEQRGSLGDRRLGSTGRCVLEHRPVHPQDGDPRSITSPDRRSTFQLAARFDSFPRAGTQASPRCARGLTSSTRQGGFRHHSSSPRR